MSIIIQPAYKPVLLTARYDIGDWDMDAELFKNVLHSIDQEKIHKVTVLIRNDTNSGRLLINSDGDNDGACDGYFSISSTLIHIERRLGGYFDNPAYSNSASYNRGFVTIEYLND